MGKISSSSGPLQRTRDSVIYPGKNGVYKFCEKDIDLVIGGRQTEQQNPAGCSGQSCGLFIADTVICTGFCDDWE